MQKEYYLTPKPGVNNEKIAFTGDLGFSSKYFRDTYTRADLLDSILVDYLSDTDYTVVNVEGCINNGNRSANKRLVHANPPECLPFLQKINSNIWALANNHISDCGKEGIENTLRFAHENGVQIDRETQRIVPCEVPTIFTNVTAWQYALLWPYAMRNLYQNEHAKWIYIYPEMKDYSKWQWFKFYLKHRKVSARNRGIISGNILYHWHSWRLGDKKSGNT